MENDNLKNEQQCAIHDVSTSTVYEVVSENLTNLGGRMGTEYTYDNWRKHFSDVDKAKEFAEKDYGKKIKWNKTEKGFRSDDLLYVMYYVNKLDIC